jgi:hypothetical protein
VIKLPVIKLPVIKLPVIKLLEEGPRPLLFDVHGQASTDKLSRASFLWGGVFA